MADRLLGEGKEGKVYRRGDEVVKVFHEGLLDQATATKLADLSAAFRDPFPDGVRVGKEDGRWIVRYPWFESEPVARLSMEEVRAYLIKAGRLKVIADNFKLSNLRRRDGKLVHIDIGRHIREFNRSTFRDVCAKAFALLGGMSEEELVASFGRLRETGGVEKMAGFPQFYQDIIREIGELFWSSCPSRCGKARSADTTLLIKCCAMDFRYVETQVPHIVGRLSHPRAFKEVILSVDTKVGGFLRPHCDGNLDEIRASALRLRSNNVVDRVIEAPCSQEDVRATYARWFGDFSDDTHTARGVPLYPQLWAFDQIKTRYVLQADCDVLIQRDDFSHDYLDEMIAAHGPDDVVGVGFNIPHPPGSPWKPYDAPPGEYKPEVRLGLFDLDRFKGSLPWGNEIEGGRFRYGWYQALHRELSARGWRSLRGGDPRTAYIHPLNSAKTKPGFLDAVRRRVESGKIPRAQYHKWDLIEEPGEWSECLETTGFVVVLNPDHANREQAERCVRSLAGQGDRGFDVVLLEAPGAEARAGELGILLALYGIKFSVIPALGEAIVRLRHADTSAADRLGVFRLRSSEALMKAECVEELKRLHEQARPSGVSCACRGIGPSSYCCQDGVYPGATRRRPCPAPRRLDIVMEPSAGEARVRFSPQFSCQVVDAFSEVPAPDGNIRPSYISGIMVWRNPSALA